MESEHPREGHVIAFEPLWKARQERAAICEEVQYVYRDLGRVQTALSTENRDPQLREARLAKRDSLEDELSGLRGEWEYFFQLEYVSGDDLDLIFAYECEQAAEALVKRERSGAHVLDVRTSVSEEAQKIIPLHSKKKA